MLLPVALLYFLDFLFNFYRRNEIMRCPKCDYISFDKEEICGGCKKNISKFSQVLSGVVLRGNVPDFLWFQKPEEEPESAEEEESVAEENAKPEEGLDADGEAVAEDDAAADNTVEFETDSVGLDLAGPPEDAKEIEFDLSADVVEAENEVKEEISFDLPGPAADKKETSVEANGLNLSMGSSDNDDEDGTGQDMGLDGLDDLDFNLDDGSVEPAPPPAPKPEKPSAKAKAEKSDKKAPELDLSGIDFSGLMPSTEEQGEEKPRKKVSGGEKDKTAADMLPDLSMDGLDLNMPSSTASAAAKKLQPAAKTGTALDNFDIDLGDLLSPPEGSRKKKK